MNLEFTINIHCTALEHKQLTNNYENLGIISKIKHETKLNKITRSTQSLYREERNLPLISSEIIHPHNKNKM